jgi:hypothetical protein
MTHVTLNTRDAVTPSVPLLEELLKPVGERKRRLTEKARNLVNSQRRNQYKRLMMVFLPLFVIKER